MSPTPETLTPASLLVVDDDPGLLRLLRKTLVRDGFLVSTVSSGAEASGWLARNRADLMLLDLKLQDIAGKELVNQLASLGRAPPFIVITGQGDERVAVEMMKQGALDYLPKDVRLVGLVSSAVRRALEKLEATRRLAAAEAALAESWKQILLVSEREQRRFGAELHDGVGQHLTGIELRCQGLKSDLPPGSPDLERQLSEICQLLREAVGQTRSLAHGLSPLNLNARRLGEALGELAARTSRKGGLNCVIDSPEVLMVKEEITAGHLFRIAQEAVNNSVKHSGATKVVVRLVRDGGVLRLEISDNGHGLPQAAPSGQGIGMQIMRHRAGVISGELEIKSNAGNSGTGLSVICTVPD